LKDALVWFSETAPAWRDYSPAFNDFTKEQFDKLDPNSPHKPYAFVSTDPKTYIGKFHVEPPLKVVYIHIKFISVHDYVPEPRRHHHHRSSGERSSKSKILETSKSAETAKPEESAKPPQSPLPDETSKPTLSITKPADTPKPAEGKSPKSAEPPKSPQLAAVSNPAELPKPAENSKHEDKPREKNVDVEYIGLWGFPANKVPENRVNAATKELYKSLFGPSGDGSDPSSIPTQKLQYNDRLNLSPASAVFLAAAQEVADGQPFPKEAQNFGFKQEDVEILLKQLSFVEAEGGGSVVNPATSLIDLLPLLHLFRLFYGYPAMDILTQPI